MASIPALTLTQLLMTRLCHDITGPIGAINNGMEVLREDPSMQAQAMELIAGSAAQAGGRIQFYRYAFGMLKGEGLSDMNDRRAMVEQFYEGSRIRMLWDACPETMAQGECQILCNLILIAGGTLLKGGTVTVHIGLDAQTAASYFTVHAEGGMAKLDDELRDALLRHKAHAPTTKSVQAYYTALLAQDRHARLEAECGATTCTLRYQPA